MQMENFSFFSNARSRAKLLLLNLLVPPYCIHPNPDRPILFELKTLHTAFWLVIIVQISKAGYENGNFVIRRYGSI